MDRAEHMTALQIIENQVEKLRFKLMKGDNLDDIDWMVIEYMAKSRYEEVDE